MHTKEPWRFNNGKNSFPNGVIGGECDALVICEVCDQWEELFFADGNHRDNGHRIVACVNALAGIADPAAFLAAVRKLLDADPYNGPAPWRLAHAEVSRLMPKPEDRDAR